MGFTHIWEHFLGGMGLVAMLRVDLPRIAALSTPMSSKILLKYHIFQAQLLQIDGFRWGLLCICGSESSFKSI